jgi:hypothetical protein
MVIRVTREPADVRRHLWVEEPLLAEIDGRPLSVRHWSVGGLVLDGVDEKPADGTQYRVRLTLPVRGIDMSFTTDAVAETDVMADDTTGHVLRFVGLTETQRGLLSAVVDGYTEDTTVSVTGAVEQIHNAARRASPLTLSEYAQPRSTWARRGISVVYVAASVGVIGYLGLLGAQHVKWLEVQTAVVATPTAQLVAQGEGHVLLAKLKAGDSVKEGDVVATVTDNALERDIELATLTVTDREARFTFAKKTSAVRAGIDLARTELDIARSRRDALVRHRDRLILRAPLGGIIADLPRGDQMGVRRGDVVAEIHAPANGQVSAYVTQAEANRLQPNGIARVSAIGGTPQMPARIVKIEALTMQADRARATAASATPARGSAARDVRVTVSLDQPAALQRLPGQRTDAPVTVLLEKAAGRYWGETLATGTTIAFGKIQAIWSLAAARVSGSPQAPEHVIVGDGRRG